MFLDSDGPDGLVGLGDDEMGRVIYMSFGRRVQISRDEYLRGADRCERAALTQDTQTARTLRKLAAAYRERARGI